MFTIRANKNRFIVIIMNIVLTIYFIATFFPLMRVLPISRNIICVICAATFLLCYFLYHFSLGKSLTKKTIIILVTFFFMVFLPYLANNSVIAHRCVGCSLVFLAPIIFDFYKSINRLCDLKRIMFLIAIFVIITGLITYYNLLINPYISRKLKSDGTGDELLRQGIGGYEFIYFVMVAGLPMLFIFLKDRRRLVKFICLVLYAFCLLLMVKANYLTALITFVVCSLIMLFTYFFNTKFTTKKITSVLLLLGFIVIVFTANRLLVMIESFLPNRISSVINSGEKSILTSIYNEFIIDRWSTILDSINAFTNNPILGLSLSTKITYINGYLYGFGQHSYIFDTFALYGIVLGVFNVVIIFFPFAFYKKDQVNSLTISMILCVILLYLLNNATESIALGIGIIYPLVREQYRSYFKPVEELEQNRNTIVAYCEMQNKVNI